MDFVDGIFELFSLDARAPALLFGDEWWSYGDLTAAIDEVATDLAAVGVGEGSSVAAVTPNSPDGVVVMLAVLRLRACLIPLSPRRVDVDLERAGPVAATVGVAGGRAVIAGAASSAAELRPGVAAMIGTAGTTGEPKRVPVTYASIDASLAGVRALAAKGSSGDGPAMTLKPEVTVVCYPLFHVSGLVTLLITLLSGRRTALLPKFEPYEVTALVKHHGITSLALNPTSIKMLVDADIDPGDLSTLRFVRSGSAPLTPELAARFQERFGLRVLQAYGQTETGGEVIGWSPTDWKEFGATRLGSVGRPHPGIEVRIVERRSHPDEAEGGDLGTDQSGELWLRGVRGRDGWHRTSDIARCDRDGFVWIEGRADDVIICGGFNLAPLAIERVLATHPDVADVAVIGVPDDRLGEVPVAVVVLRDGRQPDDGELATWCRRQLEPYQVPRRFVWVDELPRNDIGKVQRPATLALAVATG